MAYKLAGFGLFFISDMDIPGAVEATDNPRDVVPIAITVELQAPAFGDDQPIYRLESQAIIFSPPGIGAFHIQSDRIAIRLFSNADIEYARALLVATALPAMLWLRGNFLLHAASVVLPGETLVTAIAGSSGAGKSSIAAYLVENGASLLGDDSICLTIDSGQITASGLPGGYFSGSGNERLFNATSPNQAVQAAPLGRIITLSDFAAHEPMTVLRGMNAVEQILTNRHRPAVPALLNESARALQQATEIARSVPVLTWSCRNGDLAIDPTQFHDMVIKISSGEQQ